MGLEGQEFAKPKPFFDGMNPGTRTLGMSSSDRFGRLRT
jgi:hypothetical protein